MPWSAATSGFDSPKVVCYVPFRSVTHRGDSLADPAGRWLLRAARDAGSDHRTIGWLVHHDGWVLRHVIRTAGRFHLLHVMTRSRSVVTSLGRGHVPGRIKNRRVVARSRFSDNSTSMTCPELVDHCDKLYPHADVCVWHCQLVRSDERWRSFSAWLRRGRSGPVGGSGCGGQPDDLVPGTEAVGHLASVFLGVEQVATGPEVW
jgi:hypothetical protein